MIAFQVNDMTCGHCASTIARSVKAADPEARLSIDLGQHRVTIESTAADAEELRAAIVDAGYSPTVVNVSAADAQARPGSCCGHCG